MSELSHKTCEACRFDEPKATDDEIKNFLDSCPRWTLHDDDGIQKLYQIYKFKNFESALVFTNTFAAIAKDEGHHPAILTEWGSVSITWWSHKIMGLHVNDFIMCAKCDVAYSDIQ
jgi:4a-hydroxytetrahydrobiopterin dehydratase